MEEIDVTGIAGGGDGVGRLADGRAVFVRGAVPGDRVAVEVTEAKPRFARARLLEVLVAGPGRTDPPCPVVHECGGCGWQHVDPATQRALKVQVVTDALTRIGKLGTIPAVDPGPDLPAEGHRTTVRAAVLDGRAAFHGHHSEDLVPIPDVGCLVAHPLVDEVLRHGRFPGAAEVTVRAGAATGDRLVVVAPRVADGSTVPEGVQVVGADALAAGHRAWIHEEVAGRRWRISAGSFFQGRPDGAAALADVVATHVVATHVVATHHVAATHAPGSSNRRTRVVDLYGGVGLLGGVLADRLREAGAAPHLQLVEASGSSVADARHNLADLDHLRVVRADVRRWHPSPADVVVADPSRHGLGAAVVDRIAATGAPTVVLVSCDAGALGRDAGLLDAAGFDLAALTLVDHFPHTPHVEVVSAWRRLPG